MKNKIKIKRKWDFISKIITLLFILINVLILVYVNLAIGVILTVILIISSIYHPIYFVLDNDRFIIKYIFYKRIILLNNLTAYYVINNSNISMTYSTKGVFGYLGKYMDDTISISTSYTDNIALETNLKKIIISPIDSKYLIQSLNSYMKNISYN
ncbi:PH domain-containing protein [Myroides odoratimimus]|uniref:PH domain-containing protein n=1 Tax=Myroides odoratimimus TaxID=76832 RepID=UPI0031019AD5